MLGKNNHQFGLTGNKNASFKGELTYYKNYNNVDIKKYIPEHPFADKSGRVLLHRLIVEENYNLFDTKYFIKIDGKTVLKKGTDVHHLDGNHDNNKIENLLPVTRSEHTAIHNMFKYIVREENTGRIIGVFKQGELLENLEADNQQPSLSSNTFEGSTTNNRVLSDNSEDSNVDTSALPDNYIGDDIV